MSTDLMLRTPVVVTPRTCARCGRDFGAVRREYTCPRCRAPKTAARPESPRLSFREAQIVELIQQAKTNKEIAYTLCLTVGTVKEYLYRIFRKLSVTNRTELALRARENGLGSPRPGGRHKLAVSS